MFYYVVLAMTVAAFVLCHALLEEPYGLLLAGDPREPRGRPGARHRHLPLQDGRGGDLGRHDLARRRLFAFYYNNLFPEQVFHISRSIELILGPIIGGLGTLFGPIVGAFLLTALSETLPEMLRGFGIDVPGIKQVFYGICLLLVVMFLPDGVWPPLAKRLGWAPRGGRRTGRGSMTALLEVDRICQELQRPQGDAGCQLRRAGRHHRRADRPQRRRQDHLLQRDRRRLSRRHGRGAVRGHSASTAGAPTRSAAPASDARSSSSSRSPGSP